MRTARVAPIVVGLAAIVAGPAAAVEDVPTFNKDVAPILFRSCAGCHRPGEVGPFSLLGYADARKRAGLLAEVTGSRSMPPWKPVAGHGDFRHDRSLSGPEIAIFRAWAEAGAPEGRPEDRPPAPDFPEGWHLGEPDLILEVADDFRIPARGEDLYVHFVLPTGLTEDKFVRAAQVLPRNRRVAHHGVPMLDVADGTARKLANAAGGDHYIQFGGPGFLPRGFLPGYIPGLTAREGPDDQTIPLPKGHDVVLQMHYHPTGKDEVDRPRFGLYFTDKKPERGPIESQESNARHGRGFVDLAA